MEKKGFSFEKNLHGRGDTCLDTAIIRDLWKGFCFQAGELYLEPTEELIFAVGEEEVPELQGGKEFALRVSSRGIALVGRDRACLIRGMMVLMMRIECVDLREGSESFFIESCCLDSRYSIENRMIHFCVFPETSPVFVKKCVRLAAVMQYTHVVLEFWGMLKYDCLRELAWENAWSKDEVRALVREIKDMGMEAIPMFNHLGHAAGCRVSGGKHVVLDQNPRLATLFAPDGWAWNITSPEAKELLRKIRVELYELFDGTDYFHLGCDEVYSYEKGDEDQRLMREYLCELVEEVKGEGRRPIIWGDMLLNEEACGVTRPYFCGCDTPENAEKLIAALPKDTIIADWHYDVMEAPIKTSVYLRDKGFEVIGVPWFEYANSQAHVDTVKNSGLLGVMVSTWHTLAQRMPHIVMDAVQMGAYQSPWSGSAGHKIETETAALLRKVMFVEGNYQEAGWTDAQVFMQSRPMV